MENPFSIWLDPVKTVHTRQWPYRSHWDFERQYIQDLKSVAGCYGYAPEEIDGLLADGYSIEDIEEMLYCYI